MKLSAALLLCSLTLTVAQGQNPFGTAEPPSAAPSATPAIAFLNIPWNATPAEAKRLLIMPPGAIVKEDASERLVLTGGRFETYAVEQWDLEFAKGKFSKAVIKLVRIDKRNDKGWINDQISGVICDRFEKNYGKGVKFHDGKRTKTIWEQRDGGGGKTQLEFYYGWNGSTRFDITYSYVQLPAAVASLPLTAAELEAFLTGSLWASIGKEDEVYKFKPDGSFASPKAWAKFSFVGPRHVRMHWGPTEVMCVFNDRIDEFQEHGGSNFVYRRVAAKTPAVEAAPQPTAPSDPISRDLVKTYRNSLVFVTGAEGNGSGFIAVSGAANFLFTNAHVAAGIRGAGFKTLDGTAVQVGAAASAAGHDILRLQLGPGGKPFEIMQGVDENVTIDDEIVVLGNAEGAGVINTIKGKIVGVGPQLVEVDAPFQPGNSGSPIIHLKTGKVIGVATYLTIKKYDAATKEVLKAPVVRRFGYRLDSVKVWQLVNWPLFFAQAAEMNKIETLTEDLGNFLIDLGKDGRVNSSAHTNPAIKTRIDQWLADKKKRLTAKDAANVDQNFLSFLRIACRSDISAAQPRLTYDYFQRQLGKEQLERNEIADIFDKIIKDIQSGK